MLPGAISDLNNNTLRKNDGHAFVNESYRANLVTYIT